MAIGHWESCSTTSQGAVNCPKQQESPNIYNRCGTVYPDLAVLMRAYSSNLAIGVVDRCAELITFALVDVEPGG